MADRLALLQVVGHRLLVGKDGTWYLPGAAPPAAGWLACLCACWLADGSAAVPACLPVAAPLRPPSPRACGLACCSAGTHCRRPAAAALLLVAVHREPAESWHTFSGTTFHPLNEAPEEQLQLEPPAGAAPQVRPAAAWLAGRGQAAVVLCDATAAVTAGQAGHRCPCAAHAMLCCLPAAEHDHSSGPACVQGQWSELEGCWRGRGAWLGTVVSLRRPVCLLCCPHPTLLQGPPRLAWPCWCMCPASWPHFSFLCGCPPCPPPAWQDPKTWLVNPVLEQGSKGQLIMLFRTAAGAPLACRQAAWAALRLCLGGVCCHPLPGGSAAARRLPCRATEPRSLGAASPCHPLAPAAACRVPRRQDVHEQQQRHGGDVEPAGRQRAAQPQQPVFHRDHRRPGGEGGWDWAGNGGTRGLSRAVGIEAGSPSIDPLTAAAPLGSVAPSTPALRPPAPAGTVRVQQQHYGADAAGAGAERQRLQGVGAAGDRGGGPQGWVGRWGAVPGLAPGWCRPAAGATALGSQLCRGAAA